MITDPRIAKRLRATYECRINEFESKVISLLRDMIEECRNIGDTENPKFRDLANSLERFHYLLSKHDPKSTEGRHIRDEFVKVSKSLSRMFARLAKDALDKR
ncbi:hypothetical protein [Roseibium sp.]|uniref:hypothetical protein n=1 Tax=Roseibium sp. TaxID=1936156 RepID=UPI003B5097C1